MRWADRAALIGEKMNTYRVLVGKPEDKKPLGRLTLNWEYKSFHMIK
jgi:hypothetical protein